ncbi:uncharacterized protein BDZ99DRAFT_534601 [Mytilinidion resinicola]|uniref:Glycosyltransferase 2-like domain-containing protein n=1 Tax=Mytilinidion resinicola TaxID=574789 RepID=A0A6A6YI53_9PEZI|nr:uncharacterized protein BDZ99DRAFT_534601 [Mytilinidion resinicola]KAF2808460.1 hypothetical protein BDZ99DRAFT_534601 [Mytilinidion resinicola]
MVKFIYRRVLDKGWLKPDESLRGSEYDHLGVVMQVEDDESVHYISEPEDVNPELKVVCEKLNLAVAFTMSSEICSPLFSRVGKNDTELTLGPYNLTVPVVNSIRELARNDTGVRRRDIMCLVRQERLVLVWSHTAEDLMVQGVDVESKIMGTLWGAAIPEQDRRHTFRPTTGRDSGYTTPSIYGKNSRSEKGSKSNIIARGFEIEEIEKKDGTYLDIDDEEAMKIPKRPFLLTHSLMIGMTVCLLVCVESLAVQHIVVEIRTLGSVGLSRLALLATLPLFVFFALFFFVVLIGSLFQLVGPIQDPKQGNSKYYSSRAPRRERHRNLDLPHISIQMPAVYKEGLKGVIIPTVTSLMAAIKQYEAEGGTASIFVCEDGMQAIKPELADARKRFYELNNIGWCSRPPHGKDGFVRPGKFKKASNLNYCLNFSIRVEDELQRLLKAHADELRCAEEDITLEQENDMYEQALHKIMDDDGGRTQASGNIRLGEIILLVDCDTRVPVDCLALGAMEMAESPDVAIIQHASGVMHVIHTIFENAITYFTNLVYLSIRHAVGSGDYAPFVGHNAFLRWKAVQSVSFQDNGVDKFWSESHVSEDFDISLRLQIAGFVVRMATYDHGKFKEGVSLTIFDELLRWEKYAYGCSELMFNPIHTWLWRGPFTKLFRTFLWSNMKISSKFTIIGYIGTYYAIGAALPLSIINYIITGWYASTLDHYYLSSWKMLVGTLFVFNIISPICFAWFRHRMGDKNFFWALLEGVKWMPMFLIFFGGMSWHISHALLAHLFSLPMEWTSTAKELEGTGFFISVDKVIKNFKWMLLAMAPVIGGMIYLAVGAPRGWRIEDFTSIVPLANQVGAHVLLPLLPIILGS